MKKIITTLSIFVIVSCNTYKTSYTSVDIAKENEEDYIEWLNEDLFQGNVTQQEYEELLKEIDNK